MAWGMGMPTGFGAYWPSGGFEGWSQSLIAYYQAQPPEVQRELFDAYSDPLECAVSYPHYVSVKLIHEIGSRYRPHRPVDVPLKPVLDHEPPKVFVTEAKCNELASLISLNDRIVAVDEALKALIEGLDPGIHRFFPIDIVMPKGVKFSRQFYVLGVGRYFDSFADSASDSKAYEELPNSGGLLSINRQSLSNSIRGLALTSQVHEGAHLWRERRFQEWLTCFSDELHAAIEGAELLVPKMYKMRTA